MVNLDRLVENGYWNVGDGGSFSLDVGDTTGADGNGGSITVRSWSC